jgi:hypothetical protein
MSNMRLGEAVRLANYRKANGLDFHKLAALADANGVAFEIVCKRAENGASTDAELIGRSLLPETHDWIKIDTACGILGIAIHTWASAMTYRAGGYTAHYYGIRAKSRSQHLTIGPNGEGVRGCGVLLCRVDIERVRHIQKATGIQFTTALKVFDAEKAGRL